MALLFDHYTDVDWQALAYLLIRGTAELLAPHTPEQQRAVALLRERYAQYRSMPIEEQSVIAIRPESVVAWGAVFQE